MHLSISKWTYWDTCSNQDEKQTRKTNPLKKLDVAVMEK